MNAHALEVLEFHRVLERVASRASSEQGRERIRQLRPSPDRAFLLDEFARIDETLFLQTARAGWAPPTVPDARAGLRRLETAGAVLDPAELYSLGALLASGRLLAESLLEEPEEIEEIPHLAQLARRLRQDPDLEKEIEKTVQKDGHVLDSASGELRRIRSSLRDTRNRIVRELEEYLAGLPERIRVSDASVTLREGRYVIPVRREGRSEVGGIVHGESASGATLFVEPQRAVELMNTVKELESDESQEIQRILRSFSERLRPQREELARSQDAVVEFDTLWARARTARDWKASTPDLDEDAAEGLEIVEGRHPLLVEGNDEVVPFDLHLDPEEHAMVVSGPNTGGKTVFLKALGLCVTLTQSGVVPPVKAGTRLPVFRDVFADIGDEQSIAESLSTFSAHLENLKTIVAEADHRSLVLVDEMGTGTDPAEGAALARSILEELVDREARTVVTSHLGALKRLDTEGSGVVNASLQFDPDRMEPTYRLVKGRPGRSYGLAIARRLGFPGAILDRAEEHLSRGEVRMEDILEKLERQEKEAEQLVEERGEQRDRAAALRRKVEEREKKLREKERELEEREEKARREMREEARQLLLEARREVEEAIEEVRGAGDSAELAEVSRKARSRLEEAARRQREAAPDSEPRPTGPAPDLAPGDRVRMAGSGTQGVVVEVREDRAVFEAGGLRLEAPLTELTLVERSEEKSPAGAGRGGGGSGSRGGGGSSGGRRGGWTGPDVEASSEIDIRGRRVDEVEREVSRALDHAVMSALPEIRIIHGKGTGALRQKVEELLRRDSRIEDFRMGRPREGGAGVTIVSLP
ncbi:MAG: endonuclease MutS2 [Longimicrobiales bacterium]|nr:endonuclease MutS2 [Longimicrobiales bacterium]